MAKGFQIPETKDVKDYSLEEYKLYLTIHGFSITDGRGRPVQKLVSIESNEFEQLTDDEIQKIQGISPDPHNTVVELYMKAKKNMIRVKTKGRAVYVGFRTQLGWITDPEFEI